MLWAHVRNWPAPARAPEMDLVLQAERVGRHGQKITFMAQLGALPIGTFVRLPNAPEAPSYLIEADRLLAWSPAGYGNATPLESAPAG